MIRIKAMYSIVSTPSKMRRQGFVDGIACAAAFFHRGLCPLCGGGFRRCRSESLLFTPAEEGGRCPPACRLRHGLGKSYRKAFTETHISTQKAAGFPAAFRFLSEPLRGHKSRASFPTVRANCVQAQPGPCGRRFSGDPRNGGGMPWFFTLALLRVIKVKSESGIVKSFGVPAARI